jgi:hypothetical protein
VREVRVVAALLVLWGFSPSLTVAAPVDVLNDCTSTASPDLVSLDALSKVCPDLPAAITSLGIDRELRDGWREKLTVAQLRDLTAITERYAPAHSRMAPNVQSLGNVLRGLKSADPDAKSWWGRVKEWWHDWLAQSDSALAKWLRELSDHLSVSQGVLRALAYGLAAAIALMALIMGVREYQAWIRRRREPRVGFVAPSEAEQLVAQLHTPAMPSSAEEQLGRLLRALVLRLLATGRLKADRSLTHRELELKSTLDDDEQRGTLRVVTRVAEALLYGPRGCVQGEIPKAIERGEALLAQLQPTPQ